MVGRIGILRSCHALLWWVGEVGFRWVPWSGEQRRSAVIGDRWPFLAGGVVFEQVDPVEQGFQGFVEFVGGMVLG